MCEIIDIAVLQERRRLMDVYSAGGDNRKALVTSALAGVLAQDMTVMECMRLTRLDFDGLLRTAMKTKNPAMVYHQALTVLAGFETQ